MIRFSIVIAALSAAIAAVCAGTGASSPATTPASATALVPDAMLAELESQFEPHREPGSREEAAKIFGPRMETVLKLGAEAERKYPDAANLYRVRHAMLEAASFLADQAGTADARKQVVEIASRMLASPAPPEERLVADVIVTGQKVSPPGMPAPPAAEQTREIESLVKRYEGTEAAPVAMVYGAILANKVNITRLRDDLVATLEKDHAGHATVRSFLRDVGRHPDIGKPFTAELTRLDGSKLSLPNDLLGKVVVVDFWATWCVYCMADVPKMKDLYAAHKPKGVEFVGISLDRDRGKLESVVKERGMDWIQTFSDVGGDPTARNYGVRGIPSVWVVGKDGNVLSDDARGNLAELLDKAQGAPAAKSPAGAKP